MDNKLFLPSPVPPPLLKAARALRSTMTDAEQLLWYCLRRKQLGGFRFRRQHPFEMFVLDFYCCETKLAIELDGGQHNEPEGIARDTVRTEFLAEHGIQVIRFWNNDVFTNLEGVLQQIYGVLEERAGLKPPPP
jgi:very-short-patch-repair endonuclease